MDSDDQQATEFWATLALREDNKVESLDIDDEFLKGTWM